MAEQLGFEQIVGDRGAVHRDEGLVLAQRLLMQVLRDHLLAGAALAGDQHRRIRACDLVGELDDALHRRIAPDQARLVAGDGGEHGGDQLRIGRQRHVFARAGLDRGDGGTSIGRGAAGDERGADALALERRDELGDRLFDIDHQEVAALGAQHRQRLLDALGMGDGGALRHRDLGGGDELALEAADDDEAHGSGLP